MCPQPSCSCCNAAADLVDAVLRRLLDKFRDAGTPRP